jgi:hypothetical protein
MSPIDAIAILLVTLVWRAGLAWLDRKMAGDRKLRLALLLGYPVAGAAVGLVSAATDPDHPWLRDTVLFTVVGVIVALVTLWDWRTVRALTGSLVRIRRRP